MCLSNTPMWKSFEWLSGSGASEPPCRLWWSTPSVNKEIEMSSDCGAEKRAFVNENLRAEILSMKLKCVHHTPFKTSVLTSIKCKLMFAVQHSISHALTLAPQSTSCSFICSSYFNLASARASFLCTPPPLKSSSVQPRCRVKKWGAGKTLYLKRQHTWKTMTRIQTSHFLLTLSKSWYIWRWGEIICYQ